MRIFLSDALQIPRVPSQVVFKILIPVILSQIQNSFCFTVVNFFISNRLKVFYFFGFLEVINFVKFSLKKVFEFDLFL